MTLIHACMIAFQNIFFRSRFISELDFRYFSLRAAVVWVKMAVDFQRR